MIYNSTQILNKLALIKVTVTSEVDIILCLITVSVYKIAGVPDIQTSKRHATIELLQVIHVAHKHELIVLTMTRILSKTSRLFEFIDFCLSGMLADKHGYFNCRH